MARELELLDVGDVSVEQVCQSPIAIGKTRDELVAALKEGAHCTD
jgi:hypothetical protein